jgi:hypothetical protein
MCFFEIYVGRSNVRDHDSPAVAPKAVFEQARELGVAIWNVVALTLRTVFMQRIDTVAESQERPVDVRSFDHANAAILRTGSSLRASQIDQRQLATMDQSLAIRAPICVLTDDLKHSVGTRGRFVGARRLASAIAVAVNEQAKDFISVTHTDFVETSHTNTFEWVFTKFEEVVWVVLADACGLILGLDQVSDVLVVDFKEGYSDFVVSVGFEAVQYCIELFHSMIHDARVVLIT